MMSGAVHFCLLKTLRVSSKDTRSSLGITHEMTGVPMKNKWKTGGNTSVSKKLLVVFISLCMYATWSLGAAQIGSHCRIFIIIQQVWNKRCAHAHVAGNQFTPSSRVSLILFRNKDKLRAAEGNGPSRRLTDIWSREDYCGVRGVWSVLTFAQAVRNVWLAPRFTNKYTWTDICRSLTLVMTPLEGKCSVYENGWPAGGSTLAYAVCISNTTGHGPLSIGCQPYSPWQLYFSLSGVPIGSKWS